MENTFIQLALVLFFGGIATFDTLRSRKRKSREISDSAGKIFNLQN